MELKIENLSKTYNNDIQALKEVSLTIGNGMFGLLGPNGAGKSTLMRTIATLQSADSGSISLGDIDVLKEKDTVKKILGYLPQEFGLYPKVSAQELLNHFAALKGISHAAARKKTVEALLVQTNLYDVKNKPLGSFSGGMKQRFGIAQALIGNPKLIIVDEPTAGLDPEERVRFQNLLSEIGENIIVILSTHIVEDVSDLCNNMAIINKGSVLFQGDPQKAIDDIKDRIWVKIISKNELEQHTSDYNVISTRLFSGKTMIRVESERQPGEGFEKAVADLEDVYFSYIRNSNGLSDDF